MRPFEVYGHVGVLVGTKHQSFKNIRQQRNRNLSTVTSGVFGQILVASTKHSRIGLNVPRSPCSSLELTCVIRMDLNSAWGQGE